MEKKYTEADLRDAFRAGWKERNRFPGLKKVARKTLMSAIGGGRYETPDYAPDDRRYTHSIWLNSGFHKSLSK